MEIGINDTITPDTTSITPDTTSIRSAITEIPYIIQVDEDQKAKELAEEEKRYEEQGKKLNQIIEQVENKIEQEEQAEHEIKCNIKQHDLDQQDQCFKTKLLDIHELGDNTAAYCIQFILYVVKLNNPGYEGEFDFTVPEEDTVYDNSQYIKSLGQSINERGINESTNIININPESISFSSASNIKIHKEELVKLPDDYIIYARTRDNLIISFNELCTYHEITYMQDNLHDNPYAGLSCVELSRNSKEFNTNYIYKGFILLQQDKDSYVLLYNQYIKKVICGGKKLTVVFEIKTPVEMLIKYNDAITIERKVHHKFITLSYNL